MYDQGWIHVDGTLITGIVYLNEDNNPGAGTTIYQPKVLGDQMLKLPKELDWKDRSLESTGPRGMRLMRPAPYRDMPPALVWRLEFE